MTSKSQNRPRVIADEKGAVESDMQDIVGADGFEVLGYFGTAHGEHSGQTEAREDDVDTSKVPDFIPFEEPELVR